MSLRMHRWTKRLTLLVLTLPLCQTTTSCTDTILGLGQSIVQQQVFSVFGTFVGATQSFIASYFPSADVVQTFLGGNRFPFFKF